MLLAYALQYLVIADLHDPAAIALRVLAPRVTPRFVEALRLLGCELTTTGPGTHEGRLLVFPLRVIETVPVNARAGEHLLYTVTPRMLVDPGGVLALSDEEIDVFWALMEHVEQLRHPLPGARRRQMKDEGKVVQSFERAIVRLVKRLSPEQRRRFGLSPEEVLRAYKPEEVLRGYKPEEVLRVYKPEEVLRVYKPEEVLRVYKPEQRLAGLSEDEAVLALPDAMLRGLSSEYLATLPRETQEAIQKRLGSATRSRRRPAARRKARSTSK